jgi:isoleucyl-tRNA synthetase
MAKIRTARELVNETIEPLRREKIIKSSLEAAVVTPDAGLRAALTALGIVITDAYADPAEPTDTLADYLIVSSASLGEAMAVSDLKETDAKKCLRSWKYFQGDGEITPRDAVAVAALDAT